MNSKVPYRAPLTTRGVMVAQSGLVLAGGCVTAPKAAAAEIAGKMALVPVVHVATAWGGTWLESGLVDLNLLHIAASLASPDVNPDGEKLPSSTTGRATCPAGTPLTGTR